MRPGPVREHRRGRLYLRSPLHPKFCRHGNHTAPAVLFPKVLYVP